MEHNVKRNLKKETKGTCNFYISPLECTIYSLIYLIHPQIQSLVFGK